MTIDDNDFIYTSALDGVIRIHDAAGTLIDDAFVTGLSTTMSAPLVAGRGDALWGDDLYTVNRDTGELWRVDGLGNISVIGTDFNNDDRILADLEFGPDGAMYAHS